MFPASMSPLPRQALAACAAPAPPRLEVVRGGDPGRREIEAFVRGVYRARYGADVRQFAPVLVCLRDPAGPVVAAAGYRAADREPLFLERYLPAAVETLLATHRLAAPPRARIVEVGHLAAGRAGEGRRLISLIGPHLSAQGFQWAVCTLTRELRHLLVRLGLAPLVLGPADPAWLGAEAAHWGSYYEHEPVVLAGRLQPALHPIERRAAVR